MNVKEMTDKELFEYTKERREQGESQRNVARELGMAESTLRSKLKKYEESQEQMSTKEEQKVMLYSASEQSKQLNNEEAQRGTQKNPNVHSLTDNDINVLKQLIQEHKRTKEVVEKYKIYDELSKVPLNAETVRSAFNMSKDTTERLKKYAGERRLPLQDLVELAVINLLEQYDKK
jgi:transposase-like protein